MSQLGILNTLTEDQVLAIQQKAVDALLAGQVIFSWAGEGTEAEKKWPINVSDLLEECKYTLKNNWPSTYGYPVKVVRPFRIA